MSSSQITLFGKFLILGNEYFLTITLIVEIFPICNWSIFNLSDLSIYDWGGLINKSNIVKIFFFFNISDVFLPTPFSLLISDNKKYPVQETENDENNNENVTASNVNDENNLD